MVLRRAEGVASSSSSSSSLWWSRGELVRMRRAMSKRAFLRRIDVATFVAQRLLEKKYRICGVARRRKRRVVGIVVASTRQHQQRRVLTAAANGVSPGKKHGDLPKNFEHTDVEEPLYKRWEQSGAFKPKQNDNKEPFTIPMPPPNVTGALHMGHAMFVTIQDVMSRSM